jgi:Protein of unknown function (DUF669)
MFTVDHSQAKEFSIVKPGEYEVTVVNYEQKTAQSGNGRVIVDYEIRSDVEQDHQGQKILFDNFTVADNTLWRFQAASKAAGLPDGKKYGSYKEWADDFLNSHLRLVVGHREHNGNKYPEVKAFKVSEASAPPKTITIRDEDVPF